MVQHNGAHHLVIYPNVDVLSSSQGNDQAGCWQRQVWASYSVPVCVTCPDTLQLFPEFDAVLRWVYNQLAKRGTHGKAARHHGLGVVFKHVARVYSRTLSASEMLNQRANIEHLFLVCYRHMASLYYQDYIAYLILANNI